MLTATTEATAQGNNRTKIGKANYFSKSGRRLCALYYQLGGLQDSPACFDKRRRSENELAPLKRAATFIILSAIRMAFTVQKQRGSIFTWGYREPPSAPSPSGWQQIPYTHPPISHSASTK